MKQRTGRGPRGKLMREMRSRGETFRSAAETLPMHYSRLHKVVQGDSDPSLELAVALERKYGVRVEEWPSLRQPVTELLRLRGAA